MQSQFEQTFSSDDRAELAGSLRVVIAFFATVVLVSIALAFASAHSNSDGQAQTVASGQLDPLATGMPLP